jgi:hypothetical protein
MGKFEQTLAFGQVGESIISRWLQSRGAMVFPAYQIEQSAGKGPQLFSASGNLVLPDMLAFKGDSIIWVEAKHKTCFAWYRKTQRWVTGIDLRHYQEYQEVSVKTGLPVWIMFWHPKSLPDPRDVEHGCPPECPSGLFGNSIFALAENESNRSRRWGSSGMVYWAHENLKKIAGVNEVLHQ